MRLTLSQIELVLVLGHAAIAQTPITAAIAGRVISEEGRALRATVTLSFAEAKGYPAPPWRAQAGANGAFAFSHLPAGRFVLCAQIAPSEDTSPISPYVDTCVWRIAQASIVLADGQQSSGIVFTAPKGALLKLQVADPDGVLPQASAKTPSALDPELQLMVRGPDGMYHHPRHAASGNGQRAYQIVIPLKTAVTVTLGSSVANVFDANARQLKDKDEIAIQSTTPSDLNPVTLTLRRK